MNVIKYFTVKVMIKRKCKIEIQIGWNASEKKVIFILLAAAIDARIFHESTQSDNVRIINLFLKNNFLSISFTVLIG